MRGEEDAAVIVEQFLWEGRVLEVYVTIFGMSLISPLCVSVIKEYP